MDPCTSIWREVSRAPIAGEAMDRFIPNTSLAIPPSFLTRHIRSSLAAGSQLPGLLRQPIGLGLERLATRRILFDAFGLQP